MCESYCAATICFSRVEFGRYAGFESMALDCTACEPSGDEALEFAGKFEAYLKLVRAGGSRVGGQKELSPRPSFECPNGRDINELMGKWLKVLELHPHIVGEEIDNVKLIDG